MKCFNFRSWSMNVKFKNKNFKMKIPIKLPMKVSFNLETCDKKQKKQIKFPKSN